MIVIRYMPEGIWGRLRTFYKSKNDSKKI
jgi:hypothetical protein